MELSPVLLTGRKPPGIRKVARWIPRRQCSYRLIAGPWEWLIRCEWGGARKVVGVRPRGHFGPWAPTNGSRGEKVKKRTVRGGPGGEAGPVHLAAAETVLLGKCPRLVEHLITTRYADGDPRRPGLMMLDVLGATWRIRLTEPDASARLTCLGETLDDVIALAELHLSADSAPWEVDTYAGGKKGRK